MNREFPRSFESLKDIFDFTDRFFAREAIEPRHHFAVNFAVEELFTNMVKYNPGNPHPVRLDLEQADGELVASLTDFDVEPFDVTAERHVDTESPLEDRKIGGLGLHLIPKMIDSIDYDYDPVERRSRITFTKLLR
jgi:anti-sigma regulatory factor (Ser/Thr protein kinase)